MKMLTPANSSRKYSGHCIGTQREKSMRLLRASRQSIETQQEESVYLLRVQDEERRRIARELHDSTGQELAMLTINLGSLRIKTERVNHEVAKLAGDCEELAKQISTE